MRNRIDTLRGFACVLLVIYHVIGSEPSNGLRISEGVLRAGNDVLALLRMPLFALIAGWVYAIKPPQAGAMLDFVWNKSKRLLVPMVCVGSLFILTQMFTPGTNDVFTGVPFIWPVAHFWFVQAIFLIFVFVASLDYLNILTTARSFGLVFATACGFYLVGSPVQIFAAGGAVYLFPFFLLGLGVGRFPTWLAHMERPIVQVGLLTLIALEMHTSQLTADRNTPLFLIVGIALCAVAAGSGWRSGVAVHLAKYSFAIYLFHVFFTAGSRIALERLGVSNLPIHILAALVAGLVGPMLLQMAMEKRPLMNFLFLGKRMPPGSTIAPPRGPSDLGSRA